MSALLVVPPPIEGPWQSTYNGAVTGPDPNVLVGYCRFDTVGQIDRTQAIARFFAASPCLASATASLILASERLRRDATFATGGRGLDEALIDLATAHAAGRAALERLLDPRILRDRGFNAPIADALRQLPGGAP